MFLILLRVRYLALRIFFLGAGLAHEFLSLLKIPIACVLADSEARVSATIGILEKEWTAAGFIAIGGRVSKSDSSDSSERGHIRPQPRSLFTELGENPG